MKADEWDRRFAELESGVTDLERKIEALTAPAAPEFAGGTVEIGGEIMTEAQFTAARFPLLSPDPGPVDGDGSDEYRPNAPAAPPSEPQPQPIAKQDQTLTITSYDPNDPTAGVWVRQSKGDHPHTDPGDGRSECETCGKWVWLVTHSCKGVPVTQAAMDRMNAPRASISDEAEAVRHPIFDALYDLIVDHPMWIDDDGKPLEYNPSREGAIGDFLDAAVVIAERAYEASLDRATKENNHE